MPLPFKNRPLLPNNRLMALTRLEHLKRKFIKDRKYKEDYIKFINEILSRGDAEEAPSVPPESQETWYIPHHGVYHPKKQKILVVFDFPLDSREVLLTINCSVDQISRTTYWVY